MLPFDDGRHHVLSALCTRPSVATMLGTHPCVSSCLCVKDPRLHTHAQLIDEALVCRTKVKKRVCDFVASQFCFYQLYGFIHLIIPYASGPLAVHLYVPINQFFKYICQHYLLFVLSIISGMQRIFRWHLQPVTTVHSVFTWMLDLTTMK